MARLRRPLPARAVALAARCDPAAASRLRAPAPARQPGGAAVQSWRSSVTLLQHPVGKAFAFLGYPPPDGRWEGGLSLAAARRGAGRLSVTRRANPTRPEQARGWPADEQAHDWPGTSGHRTGWARADARLAGSSLSVTRRTNPTCPEHGRDPRCPQRAFGAGVDTPGIGMPAPAWQQGHRAAAPAARPGSAHTAGADGIVGYSRAIPRRSTQDQSSLRANASSASSRSTSDPRVA